AQRGGVPCHAPALAELPDLDPGAIGALLRSLEERPAKAAVFQTGVGTRALFGATDALGLTPKLLEMLSRMVVAVRGPKPTAALRARGVRIDRSAADPFTTREGLECMKDVRRGAALNRTLGASIGPVASSALREAKVKVGLESSPPKLGALLSALDSALS